MRESFQQVATDELCFASGGSQIANIRRESQARISISREPVGSGRERLFTISGTPEANTRALELIYTALENEKARREQSASADG